MLRRVFIPLLLVLGLLFAQQGAFAHALSHWARDKAPAEKPLPHAGACDQCLSHAPLGAGLLVAGLHILPQHAGVCLTAQAWAAPAPQPFPGALSRAPPAFV